MSFANSFPRPLKLLTTSILIAGLAVASPATASAHQADDYGEDGGYATGVMEDLREQSAPGDIQPAWLAAGRHTRYPAGGGTWEYGFWSAKARSYFTVYRCHGSTVRVNDREFQSINTRGSQTSIAELWAANTPGAVDEYYYRFC